MTWTIVLRVAPGFDCVSEAGRLEALPTGTSVVLDITCPPHAVDARVVDLVRTAWRSRGLHLDLRGGIDDVSAWWRALLHPDDTRHPDHTRHPARRTHLELVRP